MFLKNHPDYSALPGARQNNPYAELGIMAIFIREPGLFSHLPARDAKLVEQFQFAPELGAGYFPPQ
jgi:hypothetical protein